MEGEEWGEGTGEYSSYNAWNSYKISVLVESCHTGNIGLVCSHSSLIAPWLVSSPDPHYGTHTGGLDGVWERDYPLARSSF